MKTNRFKITVISLMLALSVFLCGCGGLSAYEIAVQEGFTGTQAEWLKSLRGTDGSDGVDGTDITIYDLFAAYQADHPDAEFTDFLESYLTIEYAAGSEAVNAALRSAVSIISKFETTTTNRFNQKSTTSTSYAAGSGVIYKIYGDSNKAYIITNYHVIYDSASDEGISTEIKVSRYGCEGYDDFTAKFEGGAIYNDIAVISVTDANFLNGAAVKAAKVADSNSIAVGENVYAVGNPEALGISATAGVVSVDSDYITMSALDNANNKNTMRVIRVDAAINGGNSGGGLYNAKGELIGIVNAKIVDESIENIAYAIPSNTATAIADSIISKDGQKSRIGVTTQAKTSTTVYDSSTAKVTIVETVEVTAVTAGGLAAGAGVEVGDILVSAKLSNVAGELMITRSFYLSDFILKADPDAVLTLTVMRGDEEKSIPITLFREQRIAL